jgi:hypothetical protein
MADKELTVQIKDLKLIIDIEEENYKTALQSRMSLDALKGMRENIKKLKGELQVLLDKESVNKTGELPGGEVS